LCVAKNWLIGDAGLKEELSGLGYASQFKNLCLEKIKLPVIFRSTTSGAKLAFDGAERGLVMALFADGIDLLVTCFPINGRGTRDK
jgi:hypothetical protein